MPEDSPHEYISSPRPTNEEISAELAALWASRPSLEEFLSLAHAEFSFLTTEHGFSEAPLPDDERNPFQVHFVGSLCRVVVEGISFGAAIAVTFRRLTGGWASLETILEVTSAPPLKTFGLTGNQRVLLALAAAAVRKHASAALRGEAAIYQAAEAKRQRRAKQHQAD